MTALLETPPTETAELPADTDEVVTEPAADAAPAAEPGPAGEAGTPDAALAGGPEDLGSKPRILAMPMPAEGGVKVPDQLVRPLPCLQTSRRRCGRLSVPR